VGGTLYEFIFRSHRNVGAENAGVENEGVECVSWWVRGVKG